MFSTFSEIDKKPKIGITELCLFCYKTVNPKHIGNLNDKKQRLDLITRFIKNVEMFTEIDNNLVKFLSESSFLEYLGCCRDCTTIASQFCMDYHQFKCLELELNWKLETLVNGVKLANTIPGRVSRLTTVCHDVVQEQEKTLRVQSVKQFRQKLVQNCKQKLLKCGPRVLVKRAPNVNSTLAVSSPTTSKRSGHFADDVMTVTKKENGWDQCLVHANSEFREDEPLPLMETEVTTHQNLSVKSESVEIDHENWADEVVHEIDDVIQEPVSSSSRNVENELDDFANIPIPLELHPSSRPPSSVHSSMDVDMETISNPKAKTPTEAQETFDQLSIQAHETTDVDKLLISKSPKQSDIIKPRQRTIHTCPCCPRVFKYKSAFKRHVKVQHCKKAQEAISSVEKWHRCQLCKTSYVSYTRLRQHKLTSKSHKYLKSILSKRQEKVKVKPQESHQVPVVADDETTSVAEVAEVSKTKRKRNNSTISCKDYSLPVQEQRYSLRTRNAKVKDDNEKDSDLDDNDTTDSSSDDYVSDPSSETEDIKVKVAKAKYKGKKFNCSAVGCKKRFKTRDMLQAHQKLHGKFTCQLCPVTMKYAPDLAKHEISHSGQNSDKRFDCTRCIRSFKLEPMLVNHFCDEHLNASTRFIACSVCNAAFNNHKSIKKHMQLLHKTEGLKPDEIHNCNECTAYFITARQLRFHLVRYHWKEKCPECGFVSKAKDNLGKVTVHIERNHPQRFSPFMKFKCTIPRCTALFGTEKELTEHNKTHGKFQCSKCEKTFTHLTQLKNHEQNFHGNRIKICTLCGKGFRSTAGLCNHMVFHEDPKTWKFVCTTCSKRFATKQKLDEHQRTHTKEKPFVCHCCGEKYAHRHNWRNHVKTRHPEQFEEGRVKKGDNLEYFSRKGSKKGEYLTAGVSIK